MSSMKKRKRNSYSLIFHWFSFKFIAALLEGTLKYIIYKSRFISRDPYSFFLIEGLDFGKEGSIVWTSFPIFWFSSCNRFQSPPQVDNIRTYLEPECNCLGALRKSMSSQNRWLFPSYGYPWLPNLSHFISSLVCRILKIFVSVSWQ